jgi:integron integrase
MVATPESPQPPKLLEQVVARLRVKHYSLRTEQIYVDWIKRFVWFHGKRHPKDMGAAEIEAFLTNLAVERSVSASTQNQAKSALLFLYKEVLQIELPWLDNVTQAKAPKRLPVVMTQNEVRTVLARLDGTVWLICSLLYGSGLRIMECLRLRVKDVDFERCEILVREGKGFKDRVTMLPVSLVQLLKQQLERVKTLHEEDLLKGYGDVFMPMALDAKYPKAGKSWNWQYIFPSRNLSVDPRSGVVRRHHSDEKVIQRAVKKAASAAEISKLATPHTFRHSFATHFTPIRLRHPHRARVARSI